MATKNRDATRFFSDRHEKSICKALGAKQQSNSGAGAFRKGDCIQNEASLLIEAKTTMTDKESFSVKKDWILKNKEEAFALRKLNSCICFNFGPEQENFYVINERLMKFLVDKLAEDLVE